MSPLRHAAHLRSDALAAPRRAERYRNSCCVPGMSHGAAEGLPCFYFGLLQKELIARVGVLVSDKHARGTGRAWLCHLERGVGHGGREPGSQPRLEPDSQPHLEPNSQPRLEPDVPLQVGQPRSRAGQGRALCLALRSVLHLPKSTCVSLENKQSREVKQHHLFTRQRQVGASSVRARPCACAPLCLGGTAAAGPAPRPCPPSLLEAFGCSAMACFGKEAFWEGELGGILFPCMHPEKP